MDPAMPDWRAFGQPVGDPPAGSVPDVRPRPTTMLVARLTALPRTTLIALAAAAVLVLGGLALALGTPSGGDVALITGDGDVVATGAAGNGGAAADAAGGPATQRGPAITGAPALVIDVAGGVARPGLVRLPAGSRMGDAITAAGGYAPSADLAAAAQTLNLAQPLVDGAKVLVPQLGASAAAAGSGGGDPGAAPSGGGSGGGKVDLNAATQAELEALPGIGPVTAGRIIEARGQAPFATIDELRSRGLVGESTFTKLRGLVTAGS